MPYYSESVADATELGVSAWLTKPLRKTPLLSLLARVTGRDDEVPIEVRREKLAECVHACGRSTVRQTTRHDVASSGELPA
jgi:hypothetical protein